MRQLLIVLAIAAVAFTATATLATAHATPAPAPSTAYCADCHPDAHPAGWARTHGNVMTSSRAEYGVCMSCHKTAFCRTCHK